MDRDQLQREQNVFAYKSRIAKLQIGIMDLEGNIKGLKAEIETLEAKLKEIENG